MTNKPKLTEKDIEDQNTLMDYVEISSRTKEIDKQLVSVLHKCLAATTTHYEIDELLNKHVIFIKSLPEPSFLYAVQKHRDKLNETEDK